MGSMLKRVFIFPKIVGCVGIVLTEVTGCNFVVIWSDSCYFLITERIFSNVAIISLLLIFTSEKITVRIVNFRGTRRLVSIFFSYSVSVVHCGLIDL